MTHHSTLIYVALALGLALVGLIILFFWAETKIEGRPRDRDLREGLAYLLPIMVIVIGTLIFFGNI